MPRPIWSGSISFGLVNIPVKLFSAVRDRDVHFHMLSKDGHCRLRRKLVCPDTGEEFEFRDTARGFEIAPDEYVVVSDKELDSLKPESGREIAISDFVELSEIDPVFYDRPYFVVPDEKGRHAYRLLFESMLRSQKVGIARFVMRQKEYLAALRPTQDIICLETMRFMDEVVPVEEVIEDVARGKVNEREMEAAQRLIEALVNKFEPSKYRDEYREKVEALIERKSQGKEVKFQPAPEPEPTRLVNLMEALQRSLAAAKEGRGETQTGRHDRKQAARRAPRKRTA